MKSPGTAIGMLVLGLCLTPLLNRPLAWGADTASTTSPAACKHPDPDAFMQQQHTSIGVAENFFPALNAVYSPAKIDGRDIQWMGALWEGPTEGALFLLDCGGKKLAGIKIGGVTDLHTGPDIPGGQSIELLYIPGIATGEQWTNVALASFDGTSIHVLWEHTATDVAAEGNGYDYDDTFNWKMSADGRTITVSGRRKVGETKDAQHGWEPGTTHALKTESYCWSVAQIKYLVCK